MRKKNMCGCDRGAVRGCKEGVQCEGEDAN